MERTHRQVDRRRGRVDERFALNLAIDVDAHMARGRVIGYGDVIPDILVEQF